MSDSLLAAVESDPAEGRRLFTEYKRLAVTVARCGVTAGADFAKGCVCMAAAQLLDAALNGADLSVARQEALQYIAGAGTGPVEAATIHETRDRMLRLADHGSVLWWLGLEVAAAVEAVETLDLQDLAP